MFLLHSLISLDNSHSRNLKYNRTVTSFHYVFKYLLYSKIFMTDSGKKLSFAPRTLNLKLSIKAMLALIIANLVKTRPYTKGGAE